MFLLLYEKHFKIKIKFILSWNTLIKEIFIFI